MTSSDDHLTRVWEAATGKLVSTISHPDYVRAAAFSPDSGQVVTLSQVKEPFGAGYGKRLLRVSEALTGKSLLAATNPGVSKALFPGAATFLPPLGFPCTGPM